MSEIRDLELQFGLNRCVEGPNLSTACSETKTSFKGNVVVYGELPAAPDG